MLESKNEPVAPKKIFARRIVRSGIIAGVLILIALMLGVIGYRVFFGLAWMDALYNASMILTGMGPVDRPPTDMAKLFASGYALFSGLIFVSTVAVVLAPILHRVLHLFHSDTSDEN